MNWVKKISGRTDREELIHSLEQIYNGLKAKNPDKDEHWLLINTWMARYENWEASKQKGPKLTKFIAYKDTLQFSFLDTPKSIRGLILYLIYKELGEKEAKNDAKEFEQIIKPFLRIQGSGDLLNEYRKRNPVTFNEIEAEKDDSIYSRYSFLETADYFDKNPEKQEQAMKEYKNFENDKGLGNSFEDIKLSEAQIEEIKRAIDEDK